MRSLLKSSSPVWLVIADERVTRESIYPFILLFIIIAFFLLVSTSYFSKLSFSLFQMNETYLIQKAIRKNNQQSAYDYITGNIIFTFFHNQLHYLNLTRNIISHYLP